MGAVSKFIIRIREFHRGQTMTEYALILAAVAVVVYVGYQAMGGDIMTLLGQIENDL